MININKENIYKIQIDTNTREGVKEVFKIFNKIEFSNKKHNEYYTKLLRFKTYFYPITENIEEVIKMEVGALKRFYKKLNKENIMLSEDEIIYICNFIKDIIKNKKEFYNSMFLGEEDINIFKNNYEYLEELYRNLNKAKEDILVESFFQTHM